MTCPLKPCFFVWIFLSPLSATYIHTYKVTLFHSQIFICIKASVIYHISRHMSFSYTYQYIPSLRQAKKVCYGMYTTTKVGRIRELAAKI